MLSRLAAKPLQDLCCGQAALWAQSSAAAALLQLQQLHASAAAATAAAPAQQLAVPPETAVSSSSSPSQSAGALQPYAAQDSEFLTTLQTQLGSKQLGPEHVGLYYSFHKELVPEAFRPFHQAFYSPRPGKYAREGGCRGLQAELQLSNSNNLMWRRSTQELLSAVASGAVNRLHLQGAPGSGKSIALVQLVEWARSNGWIALYVPSAVELTRGGFFYKRGDSDTYDTVISAQHILKSMGDSHAVDLSKLQLQLDSSKQLLESRSSSGSSGSSSSSGGQLAAAAGEAAAVAAAAAAGDGGSKGARKGKKGGAAAEVDVQGSLMQLVEEGLSTDEDGQLAVECCLALIQELAAVSTQQPVLLAVDDYNALYWTTEYGRTVLADPSLGPANGPVPAVRRLLQVEQLNLARNMRLLERADLGAARVVVADSASNRVPLAVAVPAGDAAVYHMPRFSEVEVAHALYYYHERGLTAEAPSAQQVVAMRALTNGSGTDLRKWCLKVTQTDMGML